MISFISWVNDEDMYKGFLKSAEFIEVAEFIRVGQEFNSMAKAYNEGLRRASGDIFVFVHQDVRILDKGFPEKVKEVCSNTNIGIAGVIGNIVKAPAEGEGSWWQVPDSSKRGWIIATKREDKKIEELLSFGKYNGPAKQVDGLLMVTNKRFEFPEELPSIHFVDLWICELAERLGYTNWIFDSAVKHISWGETGSEAFKVSCQLYQEFRRGV